MPNIGRPFANILAMFRSNANHQFTMPPMLTDADRRTSVSSQSRSASVLVFAVLVLCSSFGEVATGLIVPAMPALGEIYNKTPGTIQLTIVSFAVSFGVGQLFFGPLSDRKGRRAALILGASLTLVGSATAAMADDVSLIIIGRAVQGFGAASGNVVARAIVRDIYGADGSAKAMATLFALMSGAILAAPMVGGVLLDLSSWRAAFVLTSVAALVWLVLIVLVMPETRTTTKGQETEKETIQSIYFGLFRHRGFLAFMITQALGYAGLYCFIAGAPYLFIEGFGFTPTNYGVIAAIVMSGFLIGSIAARYAIPKWGMNWVIVTSLAIMLGASMILIGLGLLGWLPALIIAALEYVFWFGVGLLIPNTAAGVMMSHPNVAGAAAAFLGFTQMCTAAAISLLQGLIYDGTVFPMLTTQLALGAVAWAVWHCLKKYAV